MGSRAIAFLTLAGLCGSAQAAPTLHDQLTALAKDITYTTAALFPTQATALGIPGHDGELDTPSEANRAAYISKLQQWQKQLDQLAPVQAATPTEISTAWTSHRPRLFFIFRSGDIMIGLTSTARVCVYRPISWVKASLQLWWQTNVMLFPASGTSALCRDFPLLWPACGGHRQDLFHQATGLGEHIGIAVRDRPQDKLRGAGGDIVA